MWKPLFVDVTTPIMLITYIESLILYNKTAFRPACPIDKMNGEIDFIRQIYISKFNSLYFKYI